jgi:hypothetical protein
VVIAEAWQDMGAELISVEPQVNGRGRNPIKQDRPRVKLSLQNSQKSSDSKVVNVALNWPAVEYLGNPERVKVAVSANGKFIAICAATDGGGFKLTPGGPDSERTWRRIAPGQLLSTLRKTNFSFPAKEWEPAELVRKPFKHIRIYSRSQI